MTNELNFDGMELMETNQAEGLFVDPAIRHVAGDRTIELKLR